MAQSLILFSYEHRFHSHSHKILTAYFPKLPMDGLRDACNVSGKPDCLQWKKHAHYGRRDGLTAVREIRRLEQAGLLRRRNNVLALTGNARAAQIQMARDAGMDDIIIKPYKLDDLLARVGGTTIA
jgi:CheY-like chemotaxis protein